MSVVKSLTESYPAVARSVALARDALAAFAAEVGATREQVDSVRLASSEALTNVVVHAYAEGPGTIYVTAALVSDDLWVLIGDDGGGLRVRSERRGLGVGLMLIARASDYFAVVKRSSGGTEVRMRFGLAGDQPPLD